MIYIAQQDVSYSAPNWTDTSYWKEADGTVITGAPISGDHVYANGKNVTIDVTDDTYGHLYTKPYTGTVNSAVTGGGFKRTMSGDHDGDVHAGNTVCMTINDSITASFGDCYGGSPTYIYGLFLYDTSGEAVITVGDVYGGSYTYACGVYAYVGDTLNCNDVYGGSNARANGMRVGQCTINMRDSYGGTIAGTYCYGTWMNNGGAVVNMRDSYGGSDTYNTGVYMENGKLNMINCYSGTGSYCGGLQMGGGIARIVNSYGGNGSNIHGMWITSSTAYVYIENSFGGTHPITSSGVWNQNNATVIIKRCIGFPPPPSTYNYAISNLPSWFQTEIGSTEPGSGGFYNIGVGQVYIEEGYFGTHGTAFGAGNYLFAACSGNDTTISISAIDPIIQAPVAQTNIWSNPARLVDLVEVISSEFAPIEYDVREGTIYGPASAYTGTLAVPAKENVSLNVPVDNTVGEGIITSSDLQPLLTR